MVGVLDFLDRILFWLEGHRPVALGVAGAAVLAGVAVLVFGGGDGKPELPAGAVAVVGDQPITRATFDHWTAVYRRSGVGGTNPSATQTDHAVMQILVAASWTAQEAARLHLTVSDQQVEQAVNATFSQAKAQGVTQATVLKQVGGSKDDLRWEERASLLGQALEQHASRQARPVTQADIAKQYAAEPGRWAHATKRDVQVLLAADQPAAGKALAALKAGDGWAAVAKAYGNKQLKNPQTTLRGATPGVRDTALERAIFAAPVKQFSGPTQVTSGWIVYEVLSSTPIAPIPLSTASKTLRSELTAERQGHAVSDYLTSFRRSWRARTRCLPAVADPTVCGAS